MNENAERWVAELESGSRRQGQTYLKREPDGSEDHEYCCLGVACEMAVEAGVVVELHYDTANEGRIYGYVEPGSNLVPELSETAYLPEPVRGWLGLAHSNGIYGTVNTDTGEPVEASLAMDNDNGYSFAEIAATIRSEPDGLFAPDTEA